MKNLIGDKKGSEIGKESLAKIVSNGDKKVVEITNMMFSGKRKIDWNGVELYLKTYIGKAYVLNETFHIANYR